MGIISNAEYRYQDVILPALGLNQVNNLLKFRLMISYWTVILIIFGIFFDPVQIEEISLIFVGFEGLLTCSLFSMVSTRGYTIGGNPPFIVFHTTSSMRVQ